MDVVVWVWILPQELLQVPFRYNQENSIAGDCRQIVGSFLRWIGIIPLNWLQSALTYPYIGSDFD